MGWLELYVAGGTMSLTVLGHWVRVKNHLFFMSRLAGLHLDHARQHVALHWVVTW